MKISIVWLRASTETRPEFLDNKYIYFAEFRFFGHAEVSENLKTSSKLPNSYIYKKFSNIFPNYADQTTCTYLT